MASEKSLLDRADKSLSKLNYAVELQRIAATVGFDWPDIQGIFSKINEELNEVKEEVDTPNNQQRLMDELGDLLFACTNLARHLNIDPEQAIKMGNEKFYCRFHEMEKIVNRNGKRLIDCSLDELDSYWEHVKTLSNIP